MRSTSPARTRAVLALVEQERVAQEARYGHVNPLLLNGTDPETRWLLPFTTLSAREIQVELRSDYEEFEQETQHPTWLHLVREEIAEAFQETDPARLAEELIQVAALCVSWVERLDVLRCEECRADLGQHNVGGRMLCRDCATAAFHVVTL